MDSGSHGLKDYGSHYVVSLQFEDTLYCFIKIKKKKALCSKNQSYIGLCISVLTTLIHCLHSCFILLWLHVVGQPETAFLLR